MSTVRYNVGQILFVVSRTEARISPIQIVEEITKKTIEGQKIQYVVNDGHKLFQISEIDGEIYDSSEHMKKVLTDRAVENIKTLVDKITTRAAATFKKVSIQREDVEQRKPVAEHHQTLQNPEHLDENSNYVDIPGVGLARIKSAPILE